MLMEVAIAENEREGVQAAPVFVIVTDFAKWEFCRYDATGIKHTTDAIKQTQSLEPDVRRVIGRVCSILRA